MIDALGFAGSGLIVGSLTMRSIVRLRVVGLVGASVFVLYGALLGAWPVVVTNAVASAIHVFHLRRLVDGRSSSSAPAAESSPARAPAEV